MEANPPSRQAAQGPPLYINKWLTFMGSTALQLTAGIHYTFPMFADKLKDVFGFSQLQIQGLAAAVMFGGSSGLLGGMVYDVLGNFARFGPRFTIACGALMCFCGQMAVWAATKGLYAAQYWQIVTAMVVFSNGLAWAETSSVVTNVRNFPAERGLVVGVMKAYVGLSSSVFSTLFLVFFKHMEDFLLLLAIAPLAIFMLSALLINHVPYMQAAEMQSGQDVFTTEGRFLYAYQVVAALAVYQMAVALVSGQGVSGDTQLLLTVGMLLLVLPILFIARGSGGLWAEALFEDDFLSDVGDKTTPETSLPNEASAALPVAAGGAAYDGPSSPSPTRHSPGLRVPNDIHTPLLSSMCDIPEECETETGPLPPSVLSPSGVVKHNPLLGSTGTPNGAANGPIPSAFQGGPGSGPECTRPADRALKHCMSHSSGMPDLTPLQCLVSLMFVLLFLAMTCLCGSCALFIYNLSQIVTALRGQHDLQLTGVCTSLYSVMNCVGRLMMGYVSEKALHHKAVPRPIFLIITSLLGVAFTTLAALAGVRWLYLVSCLGGLTYGACWALMPALTSELFGLKHFATNVCLMTLSPALGTFTMATLLAGYFYDNASKAHGDPPTMCFGDDCYRMSFFVCAGLCGAATVASLIITLRSKHVYKASFLEVMTYDEEIEDDEALEAHYQHWMDMEGGRQVDGAFTPYRTRPRHHKRFLARASWAPGDFRAALKAPMLVGSQSEELLIATS